MSTTRRQFLTRAIASGLSLPVLAATAQAAVTPARSVSDMVFQGGYELVPTEFTSDEVLHVEPAHELDYLQKANEIGLQVCRPQPQGSALYLDRISDTLRYWYCLWDGPYSIEPASLDGGTKKAVAWSRKSLMHLWDHHAMYLIEERRDCIDPYRYVTTPTMRSHYSPGVWHFFTFFHISRGLLPHVSPLIGSEGLYRWVAARLYDMSPADRALAEEILRREHPELTAGIRRVYAELRVLFQACPPAEYIELNFTI